jgi:hypothetical protein
VLLGEDESETQDMFLVGTDKMSGLLSHIKYRHFTGTARLWLRKSVNFEHVYSPADEAKNFEINMLGKGSYLHLLLLGSGRTANPSLEQNTSTGHGPHHYPPGCVCYRGDLEG